MKIEVLAEGLDFPEGPAFTPDGELWCVELKGGNLVRWNEQGHARFATGGAPNGLAFDRYGLAWFCDAQQCAIRTFDPSTRQFKTVVDALDGQPLYKPNDLAFDARGNLLFTCPGDSRHAPTGYVCCLSASGELTKIADGLYFPNGLALIDDGLGLVVAETCQQRLWKGHWDAAARRWGEARPYANVSNLPGPDGMALGADGLMYVAVYRSGQIRAFSAFGEFVSAFNLPGMNPTNAAFDPAERLGLVVTEAEKGLLLSLPELGPGAKLFG
jgi:gluconolactonase